MATFLKAQVSSLSASILDFLTTIVCKHVLNFGVILGSGTGTTVGGIANFLIGRSWVFGSNQGKIQNQAFKYFIVWFGNLILTTSGVYLVTHYFQLSNYVIPKILVSGVIGVPYNYLMQKKFVFI
ncbi:GtrA family protein [Pedobacter quisquiliarum]|uniref:GtrA family protein n=1 Tax=Pedobacter quisquiliarum TaxID=1834438 RepID=UPI001666DAFC